MHSLLDDHNSSDIDVSNASPNASIQRISHIVTSTPHQANKPRVNFHSVESLAISSSVNTSSSFSLQPPGKSPFHKERSLTSIKSVSNVFDSSLITFHLDEALTSISRLDDTGYNSLNSSASINEHQSSITISTSERKSRRKLSDWQIWHLRQVYSTNRYPTPCEQEQLAQQLLLPLSSIRIWFQNYRARSGRNL
ncbi:unnamed protein product [Adineta ricciae]|uniref:Homeobox domain-containing protein n=1 Tax=Adineta ricciae TaxID=249248 RepID=A0A815GQD4_ADIRI|nr:unnamed protein product [Adineta ricciae]